MVTADTNCHGEVEIVNLVEITPSTVISVDLSTTPKKSVVCVSFNPIRIVTIVTAIKINKMDKYLSLQIMQNRERGERDRISGFHPYFDIQHN